VGAAEVGAVAAEVGAVAAEVGAVAAPAVVAVAEVVEVVVAEETEVEVAEAPAVAGEAVENRPGEAPQAGRSRCSAPAHLSKLPHRPWGRQWIERATRPRWRGPSLHSATAHRRARSSRALA
jgi:hypothetical protein